MIDSLSALILFIFGTILGSFLNALAFRYNTGKGMGGRSACMSCSTTLGPIDLVPIFSYLGLGGRCRTCKARIAVQYPLVEALAGCAVVFAYMRADGNLGMFLGALMFFMILLFIAVYDFHHTIIPDAFVYVAAVIGFGIALMHIEGGTSVWMALMPGPLLAALPAALWGFSHGRWMGLGDAKLFFAGGLFLGLSKGVAAFLLSFWIGAIVSVGLLGYYALRGGALGGTMKREVPFGPFIVCAIALVYFADIGLYDLIAYLTPPIAPFF